MLRVFSQLDVPGRPPLGGAQEASYSDGQTVSNGSKVVCSLSFLIVLELLTLSLKPATLWRQLVAASCIHNHWLTITGSAPLTSHHCTSSPLNCQVQHPKYCQCCTNTSVHLMLQCPITSEQDPKILNLKFPLELPLPVSVPLEWRCEVYCLKSLPWKGDMTTYVSLAYYGFHPKFRNVFL